MSESVHHATLAEPLTLRRGPAWPNRLALAPLTNKQSQRDGALSDDEQRWLVRRAEGGFGVVMTAAAYVSVEGKAWEGQLGVHDDAMLPGLTQLATAIRAAGAVSSVQLHHGGRRADAHVSGQPLVAPWNDAKYAARALTVPEIEHVVDAFIGGAVRAQEAGFDGAEIHGAHGYLIAQFLDTRMNHRTDRYGGSLENRYRMMREIVSGIREATSPDFQVGLRLSPERYGIHLEDAQAIVGWALECGDLDYVDISLWDAFKAPHGDDSGDRLLIDEFTSIPRGETRLTVAGKITGAADATWCLDRGADAVFVGTGAILAHDFARQAIADEAYRHPEQPVTREHLREQAVGEAFVDYLATGWSDFVI
ncbi:NADH:flavin oxidoreductase [Kribbia dieselivorans]|uniref:NADH:flavin oxidoreductase n=1 Tax=Kribbia dieselivorans TaxID=331526 RepID=UPI000837DC9B|nr:NADH:flavin oxidoreductase [Kribbia dieselivorans]